MQNREHDKQIPDAEPMLEKIVSRTRWTVIFIAAGVLELIILVLLAAADAGILHGDGEVIAGILLIESLFLILVLAPVLGFGALRVTSKLVEAVSESHDPSAATSVLHRAIIYLCAVGIMFAGQGIIVTVFVQNSIGSVFYLASIMKVWLGILVALGLFLAIASCALARKFAVPTKRPVRTIIFIGLLSVLWLAVAFQSTIMYVGDRIQFAAKTKTFDGPSSDLESTIIVPTLDTPADPGKNVIWCSSFQLAWNEMRDVLGGEPLQILGDEEITARLNKAPQSSADLEKESYFIAAGPVRNGIVEKIDSELQSRFSTAHPPEFELDLQDPNGVLAYAYLTANVRFEVPFRENKDEFIFEDSRGENTPVKSFGVWEAYLPRYERMARQIRVLYAKGSDPNHPSYDLTEFALDLSKDTEPYQIVLAIIEPGPTLAETLEVLKQRIADYDRSNSEYEDSHTFSDVDQLIVPEMFWRIAHRFQELEGKPFVSKKLIGPVQLAAQVIEFKLDRNGAILESHAAFAVGAIPRYFHFNKPFLLYMRKRDRENPFFVMWVDNAELLSKF